MKLTFHRIALFLLAGGALSTATLPAEAAYAGPATAATTRQASDMAFIEDAGDRAALRVFMDFMGKTQDPTVFKNLMSGLNTVPNTRRFHVVVEGTPRFVPAEELSDKEAKRVGRRGGWVELPVCRVEVDTTSNDFFINEMLPVLQGCLVRNGAVPQAPIRTAITTDSRTGNPVSSVKYTIPKGSPKGTGCVLISVPEGSGSVVTTPYLLNPEILALPKNGWQDDVQPAIYIHVVDADGKCVDSVQALKPMKGGMAVHRGGNCLQICPTFVGADNTMVVSMTCQGGRFFIPAMKPEQADTCHIVISHLPAKVLFK